MKSDFDPDPDPEDSEYGDVFVYLCVGMAGILIYLIWNFLK